MTGTARRRISWHYKGRVEGREERMRDKTERGLERNRQTGRQRCCERERDEK